MLKPPIRQPPMTKNYQTQYANSSKTGKSLLWRRMEEQEHSGMEMAHSVRHPRLHSAHVHCTYAHTCAAALPMCLCDSVIKFILPQPISVKNVCFEDHPYFNFPFASSFLLVSWEHQQNTRHTQSKLLKYTVFKNLLDLKADPPYTHTIHILHIVIYHGGDHCFQRLL